MKVILFIVFGVMGLYAYFDLFDFATEQKDKIETISEKATLEEKIKIPPGKEKEYALILDNKNPYNGNQNKNMQQVESVKPIESINALVENNINLVKTEAINISENVSIIVSNINIIEDTLKFNISLKNNSKNNFKDGFQIKCIAISENKDDLGSILFDVNNNLLKYDSMNIKNVKIKLSSNNASGIDCNIN